MPPSGEYGDLLDLIALNRGLDRFRDVLAEARAFLSLPRPEPVSSPRPPVPCGSPEAARRLFAMARPIAGTLAEAYLRGRGITALHGTGALRFHPGCYYRPHDDAPVETWPALIAAVTDLAGTMTGAHRTWLDPSGNGKAPIATPRRAMGHLLGNAVRFGVADDVMAAGEGIETMLSLRTILPALPMVAALSANHLAAILFPADAAAPLRRARPRCRRRHRAGQAGPTRAGGRDRAARPVADAWRLQRRPPAPRQRSPAGSPALAARPGRRSPLREPVTAAGMAAAVRLPSWIG